MGNLSRRSVLRTSLAAVAAGTLARPYIANAAATTAEVWWTQGFVPEEDLAIKKVVADVFPGTPNEIIALYAWDDKLTDVSDVIETQREEYTETALLNTLCYNRITKDRSFYGVPDTTAALPNHVWRPLVEKAGFKIEDIPKTWDAYYSFFKEVQKNLRKQGVRNVY